MNWKRLRQKLIQEYYPEQEELETSKTLYKKISHYIEKNYNVETHFAGSVSRQTCLKGDKDIDLFILFPEDTPRQKLENKALKIGKETFKQFKGECHIEYAEHPYVQGQIENHEVEIVPCYKTNPENIQSSVDRTPHHSKWLKENLDEQKKKDTVLLKQFLKANELYGSDLKTRGFSGYLTEILIIKYGSLKKLLENAENWKENQKIDIENHHQNELPEQLKEKFQNEPLKVIDPVDPERNVASVLSLENYSKFIYQAIKFNEKPGTNFFQKQQQEYTQFQIKQELQKHNETIAIKFDKPQEVEDIIYPQLRKTQKTIKRLLKDKEFRVYNILFHVTEEKVRFLIETDKKLSEYKQHQGPKIFHGKNHINQFESNYETTYIEEDRIKAKTERKITKAKTLLEKELDTKKDELKKKGVPQIISEEMKDFQFIEPHEDNKKWLNFLGKNLNVNKQ